MQINENATFAKILYAVDKYYNIKCLIQKSIPC